MGSALEKKPRKRVWISVPLLIVIIIVAAWGISIWYFSYSYWYWRVCRYYPAEFTYSESRFFSTPQEASTLIIAETFNYAQIPANTSHPGQLGFITQKRRDALNTTAAKFDPYANCGYQHYNYTANVRWFTNLTVNVRAWEYYPRSNPLQITTNMTILFPSNLPDWSTYYWLGGYWNTTHYTDFNTGRSFNYTDVYLVEMRLSYSYYFGLLSAGDELECQHLIIDTTGRVLFATWILFMGPIA